MDARDEHVTQSLVFRAGYPRVAGLHVRLWPGRLHILLSTLLSIHLRYVQYPAYDSLLDSVTVEAEQAVKRLRHHPSIIIFGTPASHYPG